MEKTTFKDKIQAWVHDPFMMFCALCGVIMLVILVVSILDLFLPDKWGEKLKIDNIDQISDLSNDDKNQMFANLYAFAKTNSASDATIPNSGALIRDGSILEYEDEQYRAKAISFVVDIDALKQSYEITHWYTDDDSDPYLEQFGASKVSCLSSGRELIYDTFSCSAPNDATATLSPRDQMLLNLPYYGTLEDGSPFTLVRRSYGENGDNEIYLELDVNSCGDQGKISEADAAVRAWIKSFDANPDEFTIRPLDLCDGGS